MKKIINIFFHIIMFSLAVLWLYPYIWLLMSSLKPSSEIYTRFWPTHFTLEHFKFILESAEKMQRPFIRAFLNSVFISVTVTLSVILTSSIISYALAKLEFKGREKIFNFLIFQMVFPGFMFTIPLYILIRNLGLLNTYSAIILPSLMSGWGIFMITQSYRSTPSDYIEAAKMDGASDLWIIFKIMIPLNKSAISIVSLFTFIGIWDNFMWPLIVMKDYNKMPLSVLLASFNHEYGAYIGPILAGAVIQTIPMVILFLLFRKYFLQGISITLK
ncbi:ABC-type sugar transport system, permease component [Marinitoga piezophila KA3]|uniref:ABC-type sugar transport system, permease component n=1 Tax=Marinitoga piezophila (strain DSM 14283 / JCM 11233 / KA3) TaxID=443254 RepID=H2J771_MARPK|nr:MULTISPECIES: carbohydrate ABC transporter permease [Marinitoga]AEX86441.1 ABC-type sugar transport system, permease component [Marinitoga piezophila KA3]APT76829.1 sugar ABC transporter permease [Marinitoga sp. 1137]